MIVGITSLIDRLGYWDSSLVGAIFLWFLFTGFKYYLQSFDSVRKTGYLREKLKELIGVAAIFEFFINIRTFSIPAEIALVFFVTVLAMLQAVSASKEEYKAVHRLVTAVLSGITIWLVVATVRYLNLHWHELKPHEVIASFMVPAWLTIATLPYLYVLVLVATYEQVFLRMRSDWEVPAPWPAKLGVISKFGGRLRRLSTFNGMWPRRAGESAAFREARHVVVQFEVDHAQRSAEEQAQQLRLERYAGIAGTDTDGRQLDEREFEATRAALQWLATCQMGWYRRNGADAYQPDLLSRLGDFTRQGLPVEHGIVMHVSDDGQAWYAYRQTITGWVFAIGASEAPPSQWLYDGAAPPKGFPGEDPAWGESMFVSIGKNWW